ncbi:hypothetical protein GWI33_002755 [Rhynchophorus ferrugineus]|uniref:FLYWCH-type domain-containing protein n=1 Tax=Rhynchophorus ferrugineus TaxID=354439 RepID=A0A834IP66_RHYFE|nr:hypothetical protein GWI33_002755 [Rhynchophorus ferrugineus]
MSEIVYFLSKRKLPMMVMKGYEYRIKRRTETKTLWTCTKEDSRKCKARVFTFGNMMHAKKITNTSKIPVGNNS